MFFRAIWLFCVFFWSATALADAPVIWFGQWAKSLTSLGIEARGLRLDKDATGTPNIQVLPPPSLSSSWQMTLPVDAGTSDYVLITDGAGYTSWVNAASVVSGTANTFAGFDGSNLLNPIPGWSWDPTVAGANVQLGIDPTTGSGYQNVHTFGTALNPTTNVVNASVIHNQTEINVGADDSGNSFSADGSGNVIGIQSNVNARNKSSVGNLNGLESNTTIGNGVDAVSALNYIGVSSNLQIADNAIMTNQSFGFSANANFGANSTVNSYVTLQSNTNTDPTASLNDLRGFNFGGNIANVGNNATGVNVVYQFTNVNSYTGVNSSSNVSGTVTNYFNGFTAGGSIANANGINAYADFLNVTNNLVNGYFSYTAQPNLGTVQSYTAWNASPQINTVTGFVNVYNSGGTASTSVPYWTDINVSPNLPLVTDGYKGLSITPTAAGDGSGYAAAAYFDASNLTNFTSDQIYAIQTNGNVNINGKLNAFYGITPIDQGGNPNGVHQIVSAVTTPPNATTSNVDTIGVNTASLMTISTNSINTSGPFGLGLAALALPAVLKTESGGSIDHVNAAVFATSLDPTSSGGTVDELVGGRFTVIPQGGTHTINTLKLVKADLPFGDPATKSWGFYGSSTTSENWFAKNIKIGGTAGSSDFVADSASVLEVEGGSINVLNGQLKTSTPNGNIYLTPNGSGCTVSQIPDNTTAGGNPRGNYCVDLQTYRNNADEVASGGVSIVMGAQNKASADFSMALGGANNYATAEKSVILGGADNTAQYVGSYVFGTGGLDTNAGDFIFATGGAPSSQANNYFRLAGDTHNLVVGKYVTGGGGGGYENAIRLQDTDLGNEDKYIALRAPVGVTTSTTFKLPNGDGTAGQVLSTNGSAELQWITNSPVAPAQGGIYSDGSAFQSVAFGGNAYKFLAVTPAETAMDFREIAIGTGGSDVNIDYPSGKIRINIPDAGSAARGVVTTTAQTWSGDKTFSGVLRTNGLFYQSKGHKIDYNTQTGTTYSILSTDYYVRAAGTLDTTFTLPDAATVDGQIFIVKNSLPSTKVLTVDTTSSQLIDGSLTITLNQYESVQLLSFGTGWEVF
jgi:hypothetical protein